MVVAGDDLGFTCAAVQQVIPVGQSECIGLPAEQALVQVQDITAIRILAGRPVEVLIARGQHGRDGAADIAQVEGTTALPFLRQHDSLLGSACVSIDGTSSSRFGATTVGGGGVIRCHYFPVSFATNAACSGEARPWRRTENRRLRSRRRNASASSHKPGKTSERITPSVSGDSGRNLPRRRTNQNTSSCRRAATMYSRTPAFS